MAGHRTIRCIGHRPLCLLQTWSCLGSTIHCELSLDPAAPVSSKSVRGQLKLKDLLAPPQRKVFLAATVLAALAVPASQDQVLGANEDYLCVQLGVLLFGAAAIVSVASPREHRSTFSIAALGVAVIVQFGALLGVEARWFFPLVFDAAGFLLKLWATTYLAAALLSVWLVAAEVRSGKPAAL